MSFLGIFDCFEQFIYNTLWFLFLKCEDLIVVWVFKNVFSIF